MFFLSAITILLNIYFKLIYWLEANLLPCPSRLFFHFECPGCGLQTGIIALLKGDIRNSIAIYPASIPILIMFIFLLLHLKFKFTRGAGILTILYIFCAAIILVSYIYKILILKTL
jgi:Protein of unknown function (DUF2752)